MTSEPINARRLKNPATVEIEDEGFEVSPDIIVNSSIVLQSISFACLTSIGRFSNVYY